GRYTEYFAKEGAQHVIAVDFVQEFVDKNRAMHSATYGSMIDFICADVVDLALPTASLDLIFSNWLLMYLDDQQVEEICCKYDDWLDEGGFVFFRESCFHSLGGITGNENPI